MNRLAKLNQSLKTSKKKSLVAYITAGYPNIKTIQDLVLELEASGVDIIELGMPFSDPIADGTTIQKSSFLSLANGMTMKAFFDSVAKIRKKTEVPLVIMTYYNLIFKYGLKQFAQKAKVSGLDGVIVPDLPLEESADLQKALNLENINLIFLVSPLTDEKRLKKIISVASGFIYYVSLTGVTGARKALAGDIKSKVKIIKKMSKLPVYVGFGISTPAQAKEISKIADGVIVGSAIIKKIEANYGKKDFLPQIAQLISSLRKSVS